MLVADPHLMRIRDIIYEAAGIFHNDQRLPFLHDRCHRRMRQLGISGIREYVAHLAASHSRSEELERLLNEITVGETSFFRNSPQLDALRHVVLPSLVAEKKKLFWNSIRIWSAGCSTGEEAYTVAMIVAEEQQAALQGVNVSIVATDLNEESIRRAQQGIYSAHALRNAPPLLRQKYFAPAGEEFVVDRRIRERVSFQRLNLLNDSRLMFMKGMDIILCCNVLIYFDLQSKRRVLQHFFANLLPGGYLFLGHSESLFGVSDDFQLLHFPGAAAYWKQSKVQRSLP